MAEATLALSFTEIGSRVDVDYVDMRHYNRSGVAQPASAITSPEHKRGFVLCGRALPGHAIEVRGEDGAPLKDREVGRIFIKGPSLTPGYFSDADATQRLYDGDWLDTGDMGYFLNGEIAITGRAKDLIIINGRNIWPQDIEWAVEKVDGVRQGGVAAFSVDDGSGERIVVVAERRGMSAEALDAVAPRSRQDDPERRRRARDRHSRQASFDGADLVGQTVAREGEAKVPRGRIRRAVLRRRGAQGAR